MSNTAIDAAYTELRMAGPDYDLIADGWGVDETLDCIGLPNIVRYLREHGGYVVTQPKGADEPAETDPTAPITHERE